MTMLDDDRLSALLGEVAAGIDVPGDGPRRILDAAAESVRAERRVRPLVPRTRKARVLGIAAAVLVVAGAVTAVEGGPGTTIHSTASGPTVPAPHASTGPVAQGRSKVAGTPNALGSAGVAVSPPANSPSASGPQAGTGSASPSPVAPPLPTGSVGQSAKVEMTGSVDLAIGNGSLSTVVDKLTGAATGAGGFVASSNLQSGSGGNGPQSYGTLVLQVPQPSFGGVLTQVEGVAKVTSVNTTSTDVTGQYVDLQARISALEASRQQYLTILSKATSIGDILAVQSQLDTIQSQIEQLQGQLNVLDSQTSYGTLTVSLSSTGHRPVPPPAPASGLRTAWHDSVGGFVAGIEWLVRIAGPTLFVLLVVGTLAVVGRFAWRAARRRLL